MNRIPRYKTHVALSVAVVVVCLMTVFTQSAKASASYAGPQEILSTSAAASSSEGAGFVVGMAVGLALVGAATILIRTRGR